MKNAYKINKRTYRLAIWRWANGLWVRVVQYPVFFFYFLFVRPPTALNIWLFSFPFFSNATFSTFECTWQPRSRAAKTEKNKHFYTFGPAFYASEKLLAIVEGGHVCSWNNKWPLPSDCKCCSINVFTFWPKKGRPELAVVCLNYRHCQSCKNGHELSPVEAKWFPKYST